MHHYGAWPGPLSSPSSATLGQSFAGAGLVCSLTVLAIQVVLQIVLCRPNPPLLIINVVLVFIFVQSLGLGGAVWGSSLAKMARVMIALGCALLAMPSESAQQHQEQWQWQHCQPPCGGGGDLPWPVPAPPQQPPPAQAAAKPAEAKKDDKKVEKKDEKTQTLLNAQVQTQTQTNAQVQTQTQANADAKAKVDAQVDGEFEKLTKKYLEILRNPPKKATDPKPDAAAKPPSTSAPAATPAAKKPPLKGPPPQPDSCYRDGKRRVKTWFSRDPACWNDEGCECEKCGGGGGGGK